MFYRFFCYFLIYLSQFLSITETTARRIKIMVVYQSGITNPTP